MSKKEKKCTRAVVDMTFRMNQLDKLDLRAFLELSGHAQGHYVSNNSRQAFADQTLAALIGSGSTHIRRPITEESRSISNVIAFDNFLCLGVVAEAASYLMDIRAGRIPYFSITLDDKLLDAVMRSEHMDGAILQTGYCLQDIRRIIVKARDMYQRAVSPTGMIADINADFMAAYKKLDDHQTGEMPLNNDDLDDAINAYKHELVQYAFVYEYFKRNGIKNQDDVEAHRKMVRNRSAMQSDTVFSGKDGMSF